jgi:hypothetical protein
MTQPTQKLSQVLAIEKAKKSAAESAMTTIYHGLEKRELFQGIARNYKPRTDEGEHLPAERKHVQARVTDQFKRITEVLTELFDLTAAKDATNTLARADIIIDGITMVENVPVTHLLWLEKKLENIAQLIQKMPVLDPGYEWKRDSNSGLWKTETIPTTKTKKEPRAFQLAPATDKHPAQVQLLQEDITVGTWETTHMSGAIQPSEMEDLMKRVDRARDAVKTAREQANMAVAVTTLKTSGLLKYIFAPTTTTNTTTTK